MLNGLPARCIVYADRAYDTNRIRDLIEQRGAVPNIPPQANRRWKSCFSRSLYKGRNAIERMLCRLKGHRCLATRYNRTAAIFLGSIHLADSAMWFLRVPALDQEGAKLLAEAPLSARQWAPDATGASESGRAHRPAGPEASGFHVALRPPRTRAGGEIDTGGRVGRRIGLGTLGQLS